MAVSLVRMDKTKMKVGRTLKEFNPKGDILEVGDCQPFFTRSYKTNPVSSRDKKASQGARILMGFNVGTEEKWTLKEITDFVFTIRRQQVQDAIDAGEAQPHPQGGDVGISFLSQSGVWQSVSEATPHVEKGAQILFMNTIHEKPLRFENDMVALSEQLASHFQQNAIILELQERGVVEETLVVTP